MSSRSAAAWALHLPRRRSDRIFPGRRDSLFHSTPPAGFSDINFETECNYECRCDRSRQGVCANLGRRQGSRRRSEESSNKLKLFAASTGQLGRQLMAITGLILGSALVQKPSQTLRPQIAQVSTMLDDPAAFMGAFTEGIKTCLSSLASRPTRLHTACTKSLPPCAGAGSSNGRAHGRSIAKAESPIRRRQPRRSLQ